jgi:hypothetical protein
METTHWVLISIFASLPIVAAIVYVQLLRQEMKNARQTKKQE